MTMLYYDYAIGDHNRYTQHTSLGMDDPWPRLGFLRLRLAVVDPLAGLASSTSSAFVLSAVLSSAAILSRHLRDWFRKTAS